MPDTWPRRLAVLCLALCAAGCADNARPPLASWTDGPARDAILEFVSRVSDPDSGAFVAPADRIAVFDNDGTLLVEQPLVQMEFVRQRIRSLAATHPEWAEQPAFRAALADDQLAWDAMSFRDRGELVNAAQSGISQAEFHAAVDQFLDTARHPRFERSYTELAYRPMLELVDYLTANDFRVFVVSSGGIEFIRRLSEPVYEIPRERVIGSVMKYALRDVDGKPAVWRKPGFQGLNAGRFKVLNIDRHIGRRPILAVGNSDGDLEMLRYADSGSGTLAILVQHDDAAREYAYEEEAARITAAAEEHGWLLVSMARDFGRMFAGDSP